MKMTAYKTGCKELKHKLDIQYFGGRGSSSSGGKSGNGGGSAPVYTGDTSAVGPGGGTIDLSDSPLIYGDKDPYLVGAQRSSIEAFENKRGGSKVEYITYVDSNGNAVFEKRGGKKSVSSPLSLHMNSNLVMSHIHPRDDGSGILGGTFSFGDLSNFAKYNNKTVRARAAEGTYSITRLSNFDRSGALSYFASVTGQRDAEYSSVCRNLRSQLRASKITVRDYIVQSGKAFNTMLVNLHNDYLAGASKYGYAYTLERNS